jgi:SAM-dependent methyltransferase
MLCRLARLFLKPLLAQISDEELGDLLFDAAKTRADSLPPSDGLRFLFDLDSSLYPLQGWLSVAYGGGLHTKHRHTRYHDFFVNRIRKGERVLDVGCGVGALAYDIAEKSGARVVGIDLSSENVAIASDKHPHPNVGYLVEDALNYAPNDPFDVVVLSNVLEHIEKRPEFLIRLMESVRPTKALFRVPVFERDWRVPLKKELGIDYRLDPTHYTEYTLESFAAEMEESGLEVTHQEVRWGEIWAEATVAAASHETGAGLG